MAELAAQFSGRRPSRSANRSDRLAVILHADVAGSTQLVQQDEHLAHERMQDAFRRFGDIITRYSGHVREIRGDALLAEFDRASPAVSAALNFQAEQAERNAQRNESIQPTVRVGIAMGEVFTADDKITGAGVVLAQRVERLAKPGGVCITEAIHEAMPQRMPFDEKSLGERKLKGFDEAVRVYTARLHKGSALPMPADVSGTIKAPVVPRLAITAAIVLIVAGGLLAWLQPGASRFEPASVAQMATPLPDKPSIAVLPFENMSSDPVQDYFADGLTDNIITSLSQFGDLFVIARHSTFQYKGKPIDIRDVGRDLGVRYVLEGSIQKSLDSLRVMVQLLDTETAGHVWAERIDRPLDDQFKVQDEITNHIVAMIASVGVDHGNLQKIEFEQVARTPTESLQAYFYFLGGVSDRYTEEDNLIARQMSEKFLETDPRYTRAIAKNAWTHLQDYWNGWSESPEDSLIRGIELARAAIDSDPNDTWSRWSMASALLLQQQHDASIEEYQRALKLSPNDADVLVEYGWALAYAGWPEDGISLMKSAIRLNPHPPGWHFWDLAWTYFVAHRYQLALEALDRQEPKTNFTHLLLAACYAQVDRLEEAASTMKHFRQLEPGYSIALAAATEPFKHPQDLEHWLDALRKAGLP